MQKEWDYTVTSASCDLFDPFLPPLRFDVLDYDLDYDYILRIARIFQGGGYVGRRRREEDPRCFPSRSCSISTCRLTYLVASHLRCKLCSLSFSCTSSRFEVSKTPHYIISHRVHCSCVDQFAISWSNSLHLYSHLRSTSCAIVIRKLSTSLVLVATIANLLSYHDVYDVF